MSIVESTLLSPARNVQDTQEIQVGAMATATGQKGSAKGRVQVSIVGGTRLTPAMIVVAMQKCAMATATGRNASAKGRVLVSIVEGTLQTPAMIVVEIEECAMAIATGQMGSAEGSVI